MSKLEVGDTVRLKHLETLRHGPMSANLIGKEATVSLICTNKSPYDYEVHYDGGSLCVFEDEVELVRKGVSGVKDIDNALEEIDRQIKGVRSEAERLETCREILMKAKFILEGRG